MKTYHLLWCLWTNYTELDITASWDILEKYMLLYFPQISPVVTTEHRTLAR